jgi:hypothetical protein
MRRPVDTESTPVEAVVLPKAPIALGRRGTASSDGPYVAGFVALAPWTDLELDYLSLGENCLAGDVRLVDEDVFLALTGDEAEALVLVEELHCALH